MATSNSEHVTCPSCSKTYRWKAALTGRAVPCKECGTRFIIPDQPGLGLADKPAPAPKPRADDDLYELATDPDDEPTPPPPAYKSPAAPTVEDHEPSPTAEPTGVSKPAQKSDGPDDADESGDSEPTVYVSEAVKASRREEQRIAAVANEPARTWRDHKGLIILVSILGLFVIIYLTMVAFSDALD